ncbi:MAG: glycoside hydrolase family 99-like domain-containing protein [Muribaculaceae bacterium]
MFKYKRAIKYMITENSGREDVIPEMAPNWNHSPRSGGRAMILRGSTPKYWEELVTTAIDTIKNKPEEKQIIMIKSWNEWGEGNYLDPDLKYGMQYLDVLKQHLFDLK